MKIEIMKEVTWNSESASEHDVKKCSSFTEVDFVYGGEQGQWIASETGKSSHDGNKK